MPRSTSRGRGKSPAGRDKNASRGKVPAGAAAPTSTSDRQSFLAWCLFCGVLVAATVSLSVSLPLTPVSRVELERIWLCCLGLSLPHLWYTWLWRSPQKWVAAHARCGHPFWEGATYSLRYDQTGRQRNLISPPPGVTA